VIRVYKDDTRLGVLTLPLFFREWDLLGKALLVPLVAPGIYSARK
jgi:hypothetical protein